MGRGKADTVIVYGHWIEQAQQFARDLGIKGRWVSVDQLGQPGYAADAVTWCLDDYEARFILFIGLTETRVYDVDGAWTTHMRNPIRWLRDVGIADRCTAIQFDDEFWSRLSGFGAPQHAATWPSLRGQSPAACWAERHRIAAALGERVEDLRRIWREYSDAPCPPIGVAESGGVVPPTIPTQEWWGLNIYVGSGYVPTPQAVQNIYAQAWAFTSLPIMPLVPTFTERGHRPADLATLGRTYALPFVHGGRSYPAILDHPQTWAAGLFCVRHPSEDDIAHGDGIGLTKLPSDYADGVRWLTAYLRSR